MSSILTPFPLVENYCEELSAPKKEMIVIPGVGHNPLFDQPEVFAQEVLRVLDEAK